MTFPAELTSRRDRVLSPASHRVYGYLTTILDFTEVRLVKSELHAELSGVHRRLFRKALDQLTARGYLVEHERGQYDVRRFTLAWSINPDRLEQQRAG